MAMQPSPEVAAAIKRAAEENGVPLWHMYTVAARESGFDPRGENHWDWAGSGPWFGRGLYQLTGEHTLTPRGADVWGGEPAHNYFPAGTFSDMTDAYDPYQNARRYAQFASAWYKVQKQKHPDWSDDQLWDAVSFNWNKGLYNEYGPGAGKDYLNYQYDDYKRDYKAQLGDTGARPTGAVTGYIGGTPPAGGQQQPQLSPEQQREIARQEALSSFGWAAPQGAQGAQAQPQLSREQQLAQSRQQALASFPGFRGNAAPSPIGVQWRPPTAPVGLGQGSGQQPWGTQGGTNVGFRAPSGSIQVPFRPPSAGQGVGFASSFAPPGVRTGLGIGQSFTGGFPSFNAPQSIGGGFGLGMGFLGNVGQAALQRINPITSLAQLPWQGLYGKIKGLFS